MRLQGLSGNGHLWNYSGHVKSRSRGYRRQGILTINVLFEIPRDHPRNEMSTFNQGNTQSFCNLDTLLA